MKKSEEPKQKPSGSGTKECKTTLRKTTSKKIVLPKYGTTKRVPLPESPESRFERMQKELSRIREKREKEEVTAHYEDLKATLKSNLSYLHVHANRLIQEATKLIGEEEEDDDLYNSFDDFDDYYYLGSESTKTKFPEQDLEEKYIFLREDSKGNMVQEKIMKPKGDNPFKIELNVKDFDPEDIHIDTTENRVLICMLGKKKVSKTKATSSKHIRQMSKFKVFGIICPTVAAVDRLKINYPQDGVLLIEGPIPTRK